ncbi:MAG: cyclic nucleotide-binding/CBS domain-containing protein [Bryobacteraceae bacterium]
MSQVRDIVGNRELFFVRETDTVATAARRMADLQCGAILVLDDGRLRGVFSERDLMLRVVLERRDPEITPLAEVMTVKLVTIEESATTEQAMEQMQAHAIRHLAVMRGDQAVAFLSMRDLMHHELSRQTDELHHMRAYIHSS